DKLYSVNWVVDQKGVPSGFMYNPDSTLQLDDSTGQLTYCSGGKVPQVNPDNWKYLHWCIVDDKWYKGADMPFDPDNAYEGENQTLSTGTGHAWDRVCGSASNPWNGGGHYNSQFNW